MSKVFVFAPDAELT